MMTILEVNKMLKQRPPFQFIDRVIELVPGEYAKGIKNVSVNEPYFVGHFPDAPVMPGVLIVECCAQLCAICIDIPDDGKINVLLKVDNFRFNKAVIPGDTLEITVKKTRSGGTLAAFDATVCVGETVFAKGSLTFATADKEYVFDRG